MKTPVCWKQNIKRNNELGIHVEQVFSNAKVLTVHSVFRIESFHSIPVLINYL